MLKDMRDSSGIRFETLPKSLQKYFNPKNIILILAALAIISLFKLAFLFILFVVLDILNSYIDSIYKIALPLDFLLMGTILISIKYTPWYCFIFLPFVLIDKLILGKFHQRLFVKMLIVIFVGFLSSMLGNYDIGSTIIIIYLLRYLAEYAIDYIALGWIDVGKIPHRLYNFFGMTAFFYLFGSFLLKLI